MSLQGSVGEFGVVDLLELMSLAKKTGVVRFSGGRGGLSQTGAIYFRDGKPESAEADGLVGEAALEVLCSWDAGSFTYFEGATSLRENLDKPVPALLERARAAQREWQEIRKLLPTLSGTARLAKELPGDRSEVRLGRSEWELIASMSCQEPLSALARQVGGGLAAYRILRKLVEEGLLTVEGQESGS